MRAGREEDGGREDEGRLFVLEFLLSGLTISGDMIECSTVVPSGIVCGETVSLLRMLSALLVMSFSRGEEGREPSAALYVGDVIDSNVGNAVRL